MTNDPFMEKWFGDNWHDIVMKAGHESCREQMRLLAKAEEIENASEQKK